MNIPRAVSLFRTLTWMCALSLTAAPGGAHADREGIRGEAQAQYLSGSLSERIVSETQGWGVLGFDVCAHLPGQTPLKLRIRDKEYAHGLGHHANGEIIVDLGRQFQTFQAEVGVEWQGANIGTVRFGVYVDGKKVFDSGVMHEVDPAKPISVSVKGARLLRLVADDAGDGINCDVADWAEARLVPDSSAPKMSEIAAIDMAPFAMVAHWDPRSKAGTSATRVTEFPGKDIAPYKELRPGASGTYRVPVVHGMGCIGLQWVENRLLRRVSLRFSSASMPATDAVRLQVWEGESTWQGKWVDVGIKAEKSGSSLTWRLSLQALPGGTPKVRWLIRSAGGDLEVARMSALTRSMSNDVALRIQSASARHVGRAEIAVYNGVLLDSRTPYRTTWSGTKPLDLKVRSILSQSYKADRTVLRLNIAGKALGVAVEDLLANDAVYIPDANLFVTRLPAPQSKNSYLRNIEGRSSVLDDVRRRPDQSFPHAWKVVHNPIQEHGPMLISLACDNRKFEVGRDGSISFNAYDRPDDPRWVTEYAPGAWKLSTKAGIAEGLPASRHLEGGWYPMPVAEVAEGAVRYHLTSFVAPWSGSAPGAPEWLREGAACVSELEIRNAGKSPADARFAFALSSRDHNAVDVSSVSEGLLVTAGGRVLALIDTRKIGALSINRTGDDFVVSGRLEASGVARCTVTIPAWEIGPGEYRLLLDNDPAESRAKRYWDGMLAPSLAIDVPDLLLTNLIRASQVHCLIAARCESGGARIAPWISADRYGPLESESNSIMRGMDMNGQADFARRSLDYFLAKTSSSGFITTGYTLVGTGECLWTLGEHYKRTHDRAWLRRNAPLIVRICRWVVTQRIKTKNRDARGEPAPGFGLMPPGVTADWDHFSYRFFNDTQYQLGLQMAGEALADIGDSNAADILADAVAYRADILSAYRWVQGRTPVVPLANGTWVLGAPSLLDCFGPVEDFFPAEDAGRTWCYSIEAGAHHLVANGILAPNSAEADAIVNNLEDVQFLRSGWFDYPEEKNRSDVYDFGGFSKVQPYYTRIAEVYALRDDVKPFIRSYFNTIPAMVSGENLSFWEHFHNTGGWNKTHETGWFLCQTRTMFLTERGKDLWLAPFVTNRWLKDGMEVSV